MPTSEKRYAQNGEDRVIEKMLKKMGINNGYMVEIGAEDGFRFSNIRYFLDNGWPGIQINKVVDRRYPVPHQLKEEFITAKNINDVLDKYNVPQDVEFLSLDIDGNDYWVFKNLSRRAKIICVEYNPGFMVGKKVALEYDPNLQRPDGTMAFGASFTAWTDILKERGYVPIFEIDHCNIIAVSKSMIKEDIKAMFPIDDYIRFGRYQNVDTVREPFIPFNNLNSAPEGTGWVNL